MKNPIKWMNEPVAVKKTHVYFVAGWYTGVLMAVAAFALGTYL
jgi:hypothetical protein